MRRRGGLLVLMVAVLVARAASQCPEGWRSHASSCWFLSNTASLTESRWQGARDYCLEQGGELASVTSQADQDFIVNWAEELSYTGELWIGLNQLQDRNSAHKWSDGSTATYRAFAPSQPNTDGTEKCVYTKLQAPAGCFEILQETSTVDGFITYPWTPPPGCSNYFVWGQSREDCEGKTAENAECDTYTYFSGSHTDVNWQWECVCCSFDVVGDNRVQNQWATSGVKISCGDTSAEFWYSTNCGYEKGFVCKKSPGSNQPVTVPPTPQVPGYCPKGFFGVDNKCFKLYPIPYPDGISWDEAREKCLQEPGIEPDIASITSLAEQSVVTAALTNHSWGLWIGYRELRGKWLWADNSDAGAYTNWNPDPGYYDCAEVRTYPLPVGSWGKLGCNDKRGYICQTYKDQGNVVATTVGNSNNCPSGFVSYWYGCYKLQTAKKSFALAQADCSSLNSQLVSIHDEAENAAVFALSKGNLPLWIGLTKEDGEYEWLDGWPEIYTKWGAGEPGNGDGCVAMDAESTWKDTTCSSDYAYMCKYTEVKAPTVPPIMEGKCPSDDWDEYGNYCFYFSHPDDYDYETTKSWTDALEHCLAIGSGFKGDLASVHNRQMNDWIHDKLNAGDSYYQDGYWIGLKRRDLENPWLWTNGAPVNYLNWAPGEPNGQGSLDSCVEMYSKVWPGLWNDHTCTDTKPFVCMAEKVPPPTLPPQGSGECPSDEWFHYGDYCFLIRPDEYETWVDATDLCILEHPGARLASVRDQHENAFIQEKLRTMTGFPVMRAAWIGLVQTHPDQRDVYHWHDGTPYVYENWAFGQPSSREERCVDLHPTSGQWADRYCSDVLGYVCSYTKDGKAASSGLSGGAITGIVFGVLIGVAALAVLGYFGFAFYRNGALPSMPQNPFAAQEESNYEDMGPETEEPPYDNIDNYMGRNIDVGMGSEDA